MNYLFLLSYGGLSFCRKRSKLLLLLGFVILWMIFGFNYSNPDYANYEWQYQVGQSVYFNEPVYVFMMSVCRKLHLGFKSFVAIEAFLGLSMICLAIYSLSPYPNPVLFLYAIFPFYLDVTQTRSFMAEAFLLVGIAAVTKFSESRNVRYFVISIATFVLAVGCHYSALLFFPILLLLFYSDRTSKVFFILIPAAYLLVPFVLKFLLPFAAGIIGGHKTFLWLSVAKSPTVAHFLRLAGIRLGFVFVTLVVRKYMDRDRSEEKQNDILFLAYMYISLNVIFELYLNSAFERTTRPALIAGNILLSRYIAQTDNEGNRRILWILVTAHCVLYLLSTLIFYKAGELPWIDFVFRAAFENSLIWR